MQLQLTLQSKFGCLCSLSYAMRVGNSNGVWILLTWQPEPEHWAFTASGNCYLRILRNGSWSEKAEAGEEQGRGQQMQSVPFQLSTELAFYLNAKQSSSLCRKATQTYCLTGAMDPHLQCECYVVSICPVRGCDDSSFQNAYVECFSPLSI